MTAIMAARRKSAALKAKRKAKAKRITKKSLAVSLKRAMNALTKDLHAAIRGRDGAVCISCGKTGLVAAHKGGTWHAGHLFGVGAFPALRLHPLNISSQGACCNTFKHGNHAAYAAAFIRRHGLAAFQALDAIKSEPRQWRAPDLVELRGALELGGLPYYQERYFVMTGWTLERETA